ncbi:MAG: alpha/beta fold hydrolase [Gemmatimonadales bacterium]
MTNPAGVGADGYVPFKGYRTWYRVAGDLGSGIPLVLLHGGPGIPCGAFDPLMDRLAPERPVIRYDQLGCGRSDRPADPSLWRVETFLEELAAVREALGLERIHLLGHSWGGMLALEYLLTRPSGVISLTLSSSLCSTPFWTEELHRLRDQLPEHVAASLRRFEAGYQPPAPKAATGPVTVRPGILPDKVASEAGMMRRVMALMTTGPVQRLASWASHAGPLRRPAYEIGMMAFMRRHLCRADPFPLVVCQDFLARNQEIYETMWGPSECHATGPLATWDVEGRLGEIDVPTLLLSGRHDEATPAQQERLRAGIRGARWTVLEQSAHLGFIEEPDRYAETLALFLGDVDGTVASRRSPAYPA